MSLLATLFADDPAPAAKQDPGPFGGLLFPMVVFSIFIFAFIWLPARRQKKEQAAMLLALKPGVKVVTGSGIIGTILKIKDGDDEMVIRSEEAKIKVTRSSIVRVLGVEEETKTS